MSEEVETFQVTIRGNVEIAAVESALRRPTAAVRRRDAIVFAVSRPQRVCINEITLRPIGQSN